MRTQELQDATGCMERIRGSGYHAGELKHVDVTTPSNGKAGFAVGCMWVNVNGTPGSILYFNVGSNTSTTWLNVA